MYADRPNILLIVLDTQRADRLSCYGHTIVTSPNLDKFAADATIFTQAVTPAQWTIPAHASLFTGVYPWQHKMLRMDSALPATLQTLAERLQQSGYNTAGFSNNPLIGILNNGLTRGFGKFITYGGLLSANPDLENNSSKATMVNHNLHRAQILTARLMNRIQKRIANAGDWRHFWFSRGIVPFWHLALRLRGNIKGNTLQTFVDVQRLFKENKSTNKSQPIFAFVNLMGTHMPYVPPRWALSRVMASSRFRCPHQWWVNVNSHHLLGPLEAAYPAKKSIIMNDLYNAEVVFQDFLMGQFLTQLRKEGYLDNTLIIITSDHGEHLGEKDVLGHGFGAYQPVAHVPLIMRGPQFGFPTSEVRKSFVSTRRLFHTILDTCGIATSSEADLSLAISGSEKAIFTQAAPTPSAIRLIEKRRPGILEKRGFLHTHFAVYERNHKVYVAGESNVKLFAIRDDPHEEEDLSELRVDDVLSSLRYLNEATKMGQETANFDTEEIVVRRSIKSRLRKLGYL